MCVYARYTQACEGAYIEMGLCMDTYIGRITHIYRHKDQDTHIQTRSEGNMCMYIYATKYAGERI